MDREISKWAEKSFEIARGEGRKMWAADPPKNAGIATPQLRRWASQDDDSRGDLYRPPRSMGWGIK
ncbi:MAG: hypothetical protein P9M15_06305 [Candidatus Electryoneaceae bacterium]|nr:hypothetical protein [Candidatus Electryoneaceae bacterium]